MFPSHNHIVSRLTETISIPAGFSEPIKKEEKEGAEFKEYEMVPKVQACLWRLSLIEGVEQLI